MKQNHCMLEFIIILYNYFHVHQTKKNKNKLEYTTFFMLLAIKLTQWVIHLPDSDSGCSVLSCNTKYVCQGNQKHANQTKCDLSVLFDKIHA